MLVLVKLGQHWRLWRGWASVESSLQIMEHHCKLGFIHSAVCAALCITLRSCTLWCMLIASLHFAQQLVHPGAESCELVLNCGALERGEDGGQQVEERIGQL